MAQQQQDQAEWLERVLGFRMPPDSLENSTPGTAGRPSLKRALANWQRTRSAVIGALRQLESGIRAMQDPLSDKAIIQVKAVAANLTAVPDTRNSVAELRRYLETDQVVFDVERPNGFGIEVRVREPLLASLEAVERALPA